MKRARLSVETLEDRSVPSATGVEDALGNKEPAKPRSGRLTEDLSDPLKTERAPDLKSEVNVGLLGGSRNATQQGANLFPGEAEPMRHTVQVLRGALVEADHGIKLPDKSSSNPDKHILASEKGDTGGGGGGGGNGNIAGGGTFVNGFGPIAGIGGIHNTGGMAPTTPAIQTPSSGSTAANGAAGAALMVDIDASAGKAPPLSTATDVNAKTPLGGAAGRDVAAEEEISPAEEVVRMTPTTIELVGEDGEPLLTISEAGILVGPRALPQLLKGEAGDLFDLLLPQRGGPADVPDWLRSLQKDAIKEAVPGLTPLLPGRGDDVIAPPVAPTPKAPPILVPRVPSQRQGGQSDPAPESPPSAVVIVAPPTGSGGEVALVEQGRSQEDRPPLTDEKLAAALLEPPVRLVREPFATDFESDWVFYMLLGSGLALASSRFVRPAAQAQERGDRQPGGRSI